jgi:hypothetical protein
MGNCAGVDWASEKHDVRVCDAAGDELLASTFAHNEAGLRSLCEVLVGMKVELVAVERPDGVLVDRLLDAGLRVLALHPNQVAATRARFRAAGGKSDHFDAFVICELARTDSHRFRVLEPDSDQTKALKALTRARDDFVTARTALVNQLRAELERFWPGPAGLFSSLDSLISLAFLKRYPSPLDAQRLTAARLAAFLRSQHYSAAARRQRRCWRSSRPRLRAALVRPRRTPAGRSCSRSSRPSKPSVSRSNSSIGRSRSRSALTPTARSSCRCSKALTPS